LIGGRAAAITVVLGSAILVQYRLDYNPALSWFQIGPFFALIGLTYALTIVWTVTLPFVERHRWLIDVQLACDALIVSAIVYLTGGVSSYFSTLYTMPIIAASTVQSWRGGLMVSLLSSFMYSGLVIAQYQEVPLPYAPPLVVLPLSRVLFTVGVNVSGFLAVAGLSGYLAEGLRRTGVQLEEASTQLADLQAFNQHVIDSLTGGLATSDMRGRVLTFNRAAESITGIAAADAVGHEVTGVLQLPQVFADVIAAGATRAGTLRHEFGFVRSDGRQIEVGLSSAPLITPRGEVGFLFTFQDVTEVKKQERDARVQQRLAAVGEMAAGIAHEIRNPLASMAGSIQILRDELPLTADQSQLMDIVLRESDRLNDSIRGFLAFARPQRSAMADGDLRLILRDTARLLANNSEVTEQHAVVVDEPPDPVMYRADQAQIRQIVWNLATNGLRAMPSGGELRLSVRTTAVEVVLAVQDEGVGIAPEEMDGIFQPFRGGFARGTGLGLSIVHRIASDYGAEVRVTSEKGKGTKVEVALPVTAEGPVALADSRKGVA
jgi:two-component system sensor histidine kinase PilS (NtrC family)